MFSKEAAEAALSIRATRYVNTDGNWFSVNMPLAYDPVLGAKIFIKTREGIVAPRAGSVTFSNDGDGWTNGMEFNGDPLASMRKIVGRETRPIPMHQDEFNELGVARFPSRVDDAAGSYHFASIYAQHGCKPHPETERCNFCTIMSPSGKRRPSIDQIMIDIKTASALGLKSFIFNDDNFVQDKKWMEALVSKIEEAGLNKNMQFGIQTRAVGMSDEVFDMLRNRLGALFGIGVETLSPVRAENSDGLGKTDKAGGARYVSDAIANIRRLAKNPRIGDKLYMILAAPSDSIADIAEDVYNQLVVLHSVFKSDGYVVPFSYNPNMMPMISDRVTAGLSGYVRAQPGFAGVDEMTSGRLGNIKGNHLFLGPLIDKKSGQAKAATFFVPKKHIFSPPVEEFIRNIGPRRISVLAKGGGYREPTIGDIVEELLRPEVFLACTSLEEREKLAEITDRISQYHTRLIEMIGPNVMSASQYSKYIRDNYVPGYT